MRSVRNFSPVLILLAAAHVNAAAQGVKTYVSPDKALRAVVTPVGLEGRDADESLVEVSGERHALLLKKSFASEDGEHGYQVVKALWTRNSQFFVFSVASSGGHQPWHAPTFVYRRADHKLLALDDFVGAISNPGFRLRAPDLLDTERWVAARQAGSKITLKLSELSNKYGRKDVRGDSRNR